MDSRAQELIKQLGLQRHPEGGWYREVFRSAAQVQGEGNRPPRAALTLIYFMLEANRHSRWHKVLSDEVWVYLEGPPLDLWQWDAATNVATCIRLGRLKLEAGVLPQHVIAAGLWQAARTAVLPDNGPTLVACAVAPGFSFEDFSLMEPGSAEAALLRQQWPELTHLI
ncbi:cupin domain-containing protein [soil metagenome]